MTKIISLDSGCEELYLTSLMCICLKNICIPYEFIKGPTFVQADSQSHRNSG